MSRKAYEQVGGFDESFFMYGEDIDLSHRIRLAGFKNYYLPEPGLIHFKGESTPRNFSATRHFYSAMLIFARKYSVKKLRLQGILLEGAIYLFGAGAALRNRFAVRGTTVPESMNWKLTGDPESIRELECALPETIQQEKTIPPGAPCIELHALGPDYTIKDVLTRWRQKAPVNPQRFHGKGTSSVVGSDTKRAAGFALALKKHPSI
jgi:N-acetylglucosaminyl-diphospho-decaprenol L-rhamnosyltransferase